MAAERGRTQQVAILLRKRKQVRQLLRDLRKEHPDLSVSELDSKGKWHWKPGVMIGTYQSAKGLEFDMVIMPFCGRQFWPDQRRVMKNGSIKEGKRPTEEVLR